MNWTERERILQGPMMKSRCLRWIKKKKGAKVKEGPEGASTAGKVV